MWEVEKMLVNSILSFSHIVFIRCFSQGPFTSALYGKVLSAGEKKREINFLCTMNMKKKKGDNLPMYQILL